MVGSFAAAQTASPTPTPTTSGMRLSGDAAPTGLSYFVPASTNSSGSTTIPVIYGGYAGDSGGCATNQRDNSSTCNSCDGSFVGTNQKWCNQTSIYPDLVLRITLVSSTTATFQGTPRILYRLSGSGSTASFYTPDNTTAPTLATGQPFTIEIKWSSLCKNIVGATNSTCATGFSGVTLSAGIDNNNDGELEEKVDFTLVLRSIVTEAGTSATVTNCPVGTTPTDTTQGICDYNVTAGDEKVYILNYAASSYDLVTADSNVKYNRVVMFYQEGVADAKAIPNNADNVVLNLQNNSPSPPSISDPRIRGLQNDVNYCFSLASMDITGNIMYFADQTVLGTASKVCATPSQVVGLLDDKHCFIATATYGSSMAPEVQTFREFRNKYLLTNSAGQSLVKLYYKFGPEAAEWISHSEALKTASVMGLWPVLLFVKLSLWIGIIPAFLVALLGTALLAKFTLWALRNRSSLRGNA